MRKKLAVAVAFATTTLMVSSCSSDSPAPESWRDIDPCTLTNPEQAAQAALATEDSKKTARAVGPTEKDNEKSCKWSGGEADSPWSVRIRLSDPYPEPTLEQLESTPDGSPYFSRTFTVGDRKIYVASEASVGCSVVTLYSNTWMAIDIDADATSPEIGTADIFADNPNCDRQKSFIESVLSRVELT